MCVYALLHQAVTAYSKYSRGDCDLRTRAHFRTPRDTAKQPPIINADKLRFFEK